MKNLSIIITTLCLAIHKNEMLFYGQRKERKDESNYEEHCIKMCFMFRKQYDYHRSSMAHILTERVNQARPSAVHA